MPEGRIFMRAVVFDGKLRYVKDQPVPEIPNKGWARIRVLRAGICKTDMELVRGYLGFNGILGHEFVGVVEQCEDSAWIGKQVVGEINAACGRCEWCRRGLGRHCPNRTTLGIQGLNGCMADYCVLPLVNLLEIPAAMSKDRAVLVEPLSAACEILEQVELQGTERALVLGDGRLGILCAWALSTALSNVTLVGHHQDKLDKAGWRHLRMVCGSSQVEPGADLVVEATGSGGGIIEAMSLCRPRGTIVLKSTIASQGGINLAPVVINELTVLGSRCGRFSDGLSMLQAYPDMPVERLITARYRIEQALEGFERATQPDAFKVLLEIG